MTHHDNLDGLRRAMTDVAHRRLEAVVRVLFAAVIAGIVTLIVVNLVR